MKEIFTLRNIALAYITTTLFVGVVCQGWLGVKVYQTFQGKQLVFLLEPESEPIPPELNKPFKGGR